MIGQTIDSKQDSNITSRFILGLCIFHFLLLFCTAFGFVYASRLDHSRNGSQQTLINTNRGFYLYPYRYSLIHLPNQ